MAQRVTRQQAIPPLSERLIHDPQFLSHLGTFHAVWGTFDVTLDFAIKRLMGISNRSAHLITVGMDFGRKVQLFQSVIKRSRHPGAKKMSAALAKIQSEARRNILAHSFVASDLRVATFIYRERNNATEAREYTCTGVEFQRHVYAFVRVAADFSAALNAPEVEFRRFIAASLVSKTAALAKAKKRASTSPNPPSWMT